MTAQNSCTYIIRHFGPASIFKEERFKTLNGLERAWKRALCYPQKYGHYNGCDYLCMPIVKITAIQLNGDSRPKIIKDFRPPYPKKSDWIRK